MSAADVAIVDVGGGRGQVLIAIKELFPDLKGRMVLQDMREVIDDAVVSGLPDWIEPMAASFFERQMVEGENCVPSSYLAIHISHYKDSRSHAKEGLCASLSPLHYMPES